MGRKTKELQRANEILRKAAAFFIQAELDRPHKCWVYTAFIIDVFSRAIVGWKVSTRMNTDMVLDALEQSLHDRGMPKNVIHHSDRGV